MKHRWHMIKAFLLGIREFRSDLTTNFPETTDDECEVFMAYEYGRDFAHRITLRHFDLA